MSSELVVQATTTPTHRHPVVCGVTLLDMDHMIELGDSLEAIAWHKAGISKPGHPLYVYPQEEGAMKVITQQAKKRGVSDTLPCLLQVIYNIMIWI